MSDVRLSVQSDLKRITEELKRISDASRKVGEELEKMGKESEEALGDTTNKTKTMFEQLRDTGRRVAKSLKDDFKALFSLEALKGALSLSGQFKSSIRETIDLTDAIRKYGATFGIAGQSFDSFQSKLVQGLGRIGLSSSVAARAMEGLLGLGVRGEEAVQGYSVAAGQLASISNQRGQEGGIARGLAGVIRARGGDVSDTSQVSAVAEIVRRVRNVTGQGPTETLNQMEQIFSGMADDLKKTIGPAALGNLAIAGAVAGPSATKFIESFLGKSKAQRLPLEAQGFGGVFGGGGIDFAKFEQFSKGIFGRTLGLGDRRLAAQTLGLSEDEAEGFVRLSDALKRVKDATDQAAKSTGNLGTQYRESLGIGEAFQSSINRVKGIIERVGPQANGGGLFSGFPQYLSRGLSAASETDAGALGVSGGAVALSALLAGAGLRGVGGALGGKLGGFGQAALEEQITGEKVIPVRVVNFSEMGAGGVLGGGGAVAGGAAGAGLLRGLGIAGGVAGAGILAASAIKDTAANLNTAPEESWLTKLTQAIVNLENILGTQGLITGGGTRVTVESVDPKLRATVVPSRGKTQ